MDGSARTALTIPNISNPVNFRINFGKMYKLCRMTIARDTDYAEFTYDVHVSKTGGNGSWQSCVQNQHLSLQHHFIVCAQCDVIGQYVSLAYIRTKKTELA